MTILKSTKHGRIVVTRCCSKRFRVDSFTETTNMEPNLEMNLFSSNISDASWDFMNLTGVESNFFTYDQPDKIILICFYIPVFFVALVGNILVLVMVFLQRSMKRNTTNYFLVNLAVADLLGECP